MHYRQYKLPSVGDKVGQWTIIEVYQRRSNPCTRIRCGNGHIRVWPWSEKLGKALTDYVCKKCLWDKDTVKHCGQLSGDYLANLRRQAKDRNLELSVTAKYLWDLFVAQGKLCALTGIEITLGQRDLQTASLDRIDSSKGYIVGNVQWVHKEVNKIKSDMVQDRFLELCKLVAQRDQRKKTTQVISRFSVEGIHRWLTCDIAEVSFLRNYHRHTFWVTCHAYVNHNDRDIEFIKLSHSVLNYLRKKYYRNEHRCCYFGDRSCEMLAHEIVDKFKLSRCEVNEDGEGGAVVEGF